MASLVVALCSWGWGQCLALLRGGDVPQQGPQASPPSTPAAAEELIGPPRGLQPPAAVCLGATLPMLHPVHQAQRGNSGVRGAEGGLGRDGGPWDLGGHP